MFVERRVRRSDCRGAALDYQLEASTKRAGFEFMLLASDEGLLVASSPGDEEARESIAARLVMLGLDDETVGEVWLAERTVVARSFRVGGQRLILAAAGEIDHAELEHALGGVARILS